MLTELLCMGQGEECVLLLLRTESGRVKRIERSWEDDIKDFVESRAIREPPTVG